MSVQYWNGTQWVTPKLKIWDGSQWAEVGGGGAIKSMQRGIASGFDTDKTVTLNISDVDINKSIIKASVFHAQSYYAKDCLVKASFIDNRTIKLEFPVLTTSTVIWEVIEFDNVKSLQRGNIIHDGQTALDLTINIEPIDENKSLVFLSSNLDSYAGNYKDLHTVYELNSTQLRIKTLGNATGLTTDINWQVIEFY